MNTMRYKVYSKTETQELNFSNGLPMAIGVMLKIGPAAEDQYGPILEVPINFLGSLCYTDHSPASKGIVGYEFDLTLAEIGTPEPMPKLDEELLKSHEQVDAVANILNVAVPLVWQNWPAIQAIFATPNPSETPNSSIEEPRP